MVFDVNTDDVKNRNKLSVLLWRVGSSSSGG